MKTQVKILIGAASCLLLALLLTCIVLFPPGVQRNQDQLHSLTLEEYLKGDYQYKTYSPYWVSGNEYLYQSAEDDVILYNAETGQSVTLLTNSTLSQVKATNYALSANQNFILLESNYSKLWRYSYTASYHIYDLIHGDFVKEYELPHNIQYISWSPTGHKLISMKIILLHLPPFDQLGDFVEFFFS